MLLGTLPKLVFSLRKGKPFREHLNPDFQQLLFHLKQLFGQK